MKCSETFCVSITRHCDGPLLLINCLQKVDTYRVNFAITNNLWNVLFRGEAVSRVSDTNRTSPTTWGTLSLAITRNNRKNPIPKARSVFGTRACTIIVTAVNYFRQQTNSGQASACDGEIITGKRPKLYWTYSERRLTHN